MQSTFAQTKTYSNKAAQGNTHTNTLVLVIELDIYLNHHSFGICKNYSHGNIPSRVRGLVCGEEHNVVRCDVCQTWGSCEIAMFHMPLLAPQLAL